MLKTPTRHAELVSASYSPRRNSKILNQVQDDEAWKTDVGKRETAPNPLP
jgi:hypothetical protein